MNNDEKKDAPKVGDNLKPNMGEHPPKITEPYFINFYENSVIDLQKDQRFLDMLFGRLADIGYCNIGPQCAYTEHGTPYIANAFKIHKSILFQDAPDKQRIQFKVLSFMEAMIRNCLYKNKSAYGNLVFRSVEFSQESEMVQLYVRFCLESN